MTLGQFIAALVEQQAALGADVDVMVQVTNMDNGQMSDAFDLAVLPDPYMPGVVVIAGSGPALATQMNAGGPASPRRHFFERLRTDSKDAPARPD
jgi:hypothetical protein